MTKPTITPELADRLNDCTARVDKILACLGRMENGDRVVRVTDLIDIACQCGIVKGNLGAVRELLGIDAAGGADD